MSEKRLIKYTISGHNFNLWSDVGVFSKNELDYGSKFLIEKALQKYLGSSIMDLGCGYGPIGITLAFFNEQVLVDCIDINERAVLLCQENIVLNNLMNCQAYVSDSFSNVKKKYNTILLNPPIRAGKQVIYKMFEDSFNHLEEDGMLLIVMRKDQGALSAKKRLEEIFISCEMIDRSKGFMILEAKKKK